MSVKKIVRQIPRKVGRPTTVGGDRTVTIRLPAEQLDAIDDWAAKAGVGRSDAIRRLVERSLASEANAMKPRRAPKPK